MGEDAGSAGTQIGSAARTPDEIRRSIERTRAELGDTVAALAQKTDVKARARQRVALVRTQAPQTLRTRAAALGAGVRANPAPAAAGAIAGVALVAWRLLRR